MFIGGILEVEDLPLQLSKLDYSYHYATDLFHAENGTLPDVLMVNVGSFEDL